MGSKRWQDFKCYFMKHVASEYDVKLLSIRDNIVSKCTNCGRNIRLSRFEYFGGEWRTYLIEEI